jgi:16S rRNA (uracil1498-N3)-methyltransferase
MIRQDKHEFAVFVGMSVPFASQKYEIDVSDDALYTRLSGVLRARSGDRYIFFNDTYHARAEVIAVEKKKIRVVLEAAEKNKALTPAIDWIVPLLEREAFEIVVSNLTVLGATSIQPVVTRKTHRNAIFEKEVERLTRLMIAAAEQSKQFVVPSIKPLIQMQNLESSLTVRDGQWRLFFDPHGASSHEMLTVLHGNAVDHLTCMVGPEGDVTSDEKELLKNLNFNFYSLTPSILRAELAVIVSMGMLRSVLR